MKKWIIFTIIYALLTVWLSFKANDNVFGPDKEGTITIAIIFYVAIIIIYTIYKFLRKLFAKNE